MSKDNTLDERIEEKLYMGSGNGWFDNGKTKEAIKSLIAEERRKAYEEGKTAGWLEYKEKVMGELSPKDQGILSKLEQEDE